MKKAIRKEAPSGVSFSPAVPAHMVRAAQLSELDSKNPAFIHMYQSPDIFDPNKGKVLAWEMKVKGQEVVKGADGEVLHHMGDPIVRMPRAQFLAERAAEEASSREALKSRVKRVSNVKAEPKKPTDGEEEAAQPGPETLVEPESPDPEDNEEKTEG
jgi:hypothetical protein